MRGDDRGPRRRPPPESGWRAASSRGAVRRPGAAASRMNLKYCDYDFSKMKDPKGGFILEEQSAPTEEEERKKEREMIDKRNLLEANPVCESCESPGEIDTNFLYYFGVPVCNSCRKSNSERYSLLTKTECRKVGASGGWTGLFR